MKIKELYEKAVYNWPVKAVCILMSMMLYGFYTLSRQDTRTFISPLKIAASNGITVAGSYPTNVKITLKGKGEEISSIRESEVKAYLDLNYLAKEGVYKLPVLVELPKEALLLDTLEVRVVPQEVELKVEEQISGFVPVLPLTKGNPAYGYELKKITVSPDFVEVTGPRSMVENCHRIQTKAVSIKNADTSLSSKVNLENLGGLLKLKENVPVQLTAEIVPLYQVKKIDAIPVEFFNVPDEYEIIPKAVLLSATIKGRLLDLENYKISKGVLKVDCSKVEKEGIYELPVFSSFPQEFEVTDLSSSSLKLEFKKLQKEENLYAENQKTSAANISEESDAGEVE